MGEPDMTDNWMNPPPRRETTYTPPKYPRYLIQRKRRLDYFPFEGWGHWSTFEVRAERDAALTKLRSEHPAWQLRAVDELHPPMAYN